LTYLRSCSDISLYCVYNQFNTDLLLTRNKGCPSIKEEAHKRKEHELCEMVWLSDFHNRQEDTGPSKEIHTLLTGIEEDKTPIFLDALEVQEAL
jgi:hypothetical protein